METLLADNRRNLGDFEVVDFVHEVQVAGLRAKFDVEVFAKLLQRKLGVIHPIDPTLKVLLDKLLAAPTWKTKVLGMQTLFEGMAVGIMDIVKRANTSPLIEDIITRVHQDEARHAA